MLHLAEVDGGDSVDSELVEGGGGVGGEEFCEVSVRAAWDGVEWGIGVSVVIVMEDVCREQIITEFFVVEGKRMIFSD